MLSFRGVPFGRLRKVRRRSMEFERDEVSDEVSEWPLGRKTGRMGRTERILAVKKKEFKDQTSSMFTTCYNATSIVHLLYRIHSLLDHGFDM